MRLSVRLVHLRKFQLTQEQTHTKHTQRTFSPDHKKKNYQTVSRNLSVLRFRDGNQGRREERRRSGWIHLRVSRRTRRLATSSEVTGEEVPMTIDISNSLGKGNDASAYAVGTFSFKRESFSVSARVRKRVLVCSCACENVCPCACVCTCEFVCACSCSWVFVSA